MNDTTLLYSSYSTSLPTQISIVSLLIDKNTNLSKTL